MRPADAPRRRPDPMRWLWYAFGAYFDPSVEHRLAKHGYPSGTAHRILSEQDRAKHPDRVRRYMQTYRDNASCG
jgi:hypothetical protein